MSRLRLFLALALCTIAGTLRADEDDPKLRNRPLSEWLEMLRADPAPERRRAALLAVELIGTAKSPKVLPAILAALRDDADDKVREAAAVAIGRIGERLAARPLAEKVSFVQGRASLVSALRTDKADRVGAASATALSKLDKADAADAVADLADALLKKGPQTRAAAADTLRRLGKDAAPALPALRQALEKDRDLATRMLAAQAVGNLGETAIEALPSLLAVLDDGQAPVEVRKAVADTLGRLGPDAGASAAKLGMLLAAKDVDVELRRAAAGALDQFGPEAKPALSGLRKALLDDDRFVRSLALHAIGRVGASLEDEAHATIVAVLACVGDRVVEVRVAAVETLATLGAEVLGPDLMAARERLKEATKDGQKAVREAAEAALKKLMPAS